MEAKCNCARIRQETSCRSVLRTDCHRWRIVSDHPVRRGGTDLSSLMKVSCRIDTDVKQAFVTRLDMWIVATVQLCGSSDDFL